MSPKNKRIINRRRFLADTAGVVAGGTLGLQAKYLLAAEQGGVRKRSRVRLRTKEREEYIYIYIYIVRERYLYFCV